MEENQELKAGHPPAQKVGGMRIVQQKKPEKHEGSPPKVSEDEKEDVGDEKTVKAASVIQILFLMSNSCIFSFNYFKLHVHSLRETFVNRHLVLLFDRLPIWRKLEKFFIYIRLQYNMFL